MTTETVESYFRRNAIKYRRQSSGRWGVNLEFDCPICQRQKKAQISNSSWLWQCHSGKCDAKGNEIVLKQAYGHIYELQGTDGRDLEQLRNEQFLEAMRSRASTKNDVERWSWDLWRSKAAEPARDYLAARGLSRAICERAYVGWSEVWPGKDKTHDYGYLMLPALTESGNTETCAMVKVRSLNPDIPKSNRYRRLAGGTSILYAPSGIDPSETVMLVGGELDVLSVMQAGYDNVACSTTGETNWDDVYTKQLSECEDMVIAYDDDEGGRDGTETVVRALGLHRCRIGQWPDGCNDANDVLQKHLSDFDLFMVQSIITNSKVPRLAGIIRPEAIREKIHAWFEGAAADGWSTGWRDLDEQFGGWRPGEVTIVTGDTGCGKTSMTSQAALFQAKSLQRPTLYCPFEMGPRRQMLKWMRQLSRRSPRYMDREGRDTWIDTICEMPMTIFFTRDKDNIEATRNTLLYAYSRLRIQFVVIDHLHAMVQEGPAERIALSQFAEMFAEVAVDTGMHIVVVAHPHALAAMKTQARDNQVVQLSDIKGSSSIKQYCDNAMSIWRPRKAKRDQVVGEDGFGQSVIYLLKVRDEDGLEGRVPLRYDVTAARLLDESGPFEKPKGTWHDDYD